MRRLAIGLCLWTATTLTVDDRGAGRFAICSTGKPAYGQEEPKPAEPPPSEAPAEAPAAEPPAASPPGVGGAPSAEVAAARTPTDNVNVKGERWNDIMVLPRRPVLKAKRVELMPMYQFNLNNPLIRNHGVGLQLNYFLSEALWIGLEGTYYLPQQANDPTGTDFLVGAQSKVLPAVNKLVFSTLLDFGYVPVYGKFALFNRAIIHWEAYVTLGVGVFMSQVIPIKLSDPAFTNVSAMFVFPGVGTRLFFTKWLALNAFLKLYGYPDTFEPVAKNITPTSAPASCMLPAQSDPNFASDYSSCRKNNGDTSLVLDVVFGLGLTFFLPTKFEFKLPR